MAGFEHIVRNELYIKENFTNYNMRVKRYFMHAINVGLDSGLEMRVPCLPNRQAYYTLIRKIVLL